MVNYEEVKPIVKATYHKLRYCYESLYDLIQLDLITPQDGSVLQRHIRDVMTQIDDFILENELG